MAKEPKDTAASRFDPNKQYEVQMRRTVPLPGFPHHLLRPSEHVVLSGSAAEQLRDDISSAKEI